jgi:hypothetical protein
MLGNLPLHDFHDELLIVENKIRDLLERYSLASQLSDPRV